MAFVGFALTITGLPVVFTTSDMGTLTCSSPLWFGGETGVSYANGWLDWPSGTLSVRAKPLDGDLEVSPASFTLHDATSGGHPLLTWLATRDSARIVSTPLASTITATATSITVGDGGLFPAPCFAWLNGEVLRVSSVAGNVLTATRGKLGTRAKMQRVDAAAGAFPEVFTEFSGIARRKVCLWGVDSASAATLLWVGYAVRAPVLSSDGARFTVSPDPMWTVQRQSPVGEALGATRLVGFSDGRSREDRSAPPLLKSTLQLTGGTPPVVPVYSNGSYRDLESLLEAHARSIATQTNAAGVRVEAHLARSGLNAFRVDLDASAAFSARVKFLSSDDAATLIAALRVASPSRYSVSGAVSPVMSSAVMLFPSVPGGTWPVASLASLPSSWTPVTTTDVVVTTETPGLRLNVDDDWNVIFGDISTADGGELGPRFSASMTWQARKPALQPATGVKVVQNPTALQMVYRVRSEHWAYGLKHSVVGLAEDAHADDWDWSGLSTVLTVTAGLRTARDWVFDGRRTLGSVVTECSLLHGCSPVIRAGRLALHAWTWPSAGETAVATLTSADILGMPTWMRWQDGLANRLQIKSDALTIDASRMQSRARFGPGRNITVELAGIEDQTLPVDDPLAFAREVVGRLALWEEPLGVVKFRVRGELLSTLELGRVFAVSEWMLPDGAGARGLSDALAMVIASELDFASGTVSVEGVVFIRRSYPYAPCAKVASVVSAYVVQLATGYVGGVYTYSGGNDASTFQAGDVVELIERDTTTLWTEQLTVASSDPATGRVVFTTAPSATAASKIAGGWVDLRFAPYAAVTATQGSRWMFVADDAAGVIDGTAEPQRLIAP